MWNLFVYAKSKMSVLQYLSKDISMSIDKSSISKFWKLILVVRDSGTVAIIRVVLFISGQPFYDLNVVYIVDAFSPSWCIHGCI